MRELIDLTAPIVRDHFRWPTEQTLVKRFDNGDQFQVTRIDIVVHGFTHIDAPRHMLPTGDSTTDFEIRRLVQPMTVVNLLGINEEQEITAARLRQSATDRHEGDSVLFQTGWDSRYSLSGPEYWERSPYLSRGAAELLLSWKPSFVAFDFPQDYCIRELLEGGSPTVEEYVSHDVLLRNGIYLVEYVVNTIAVTGTRAEGWVFPMKILDADGAPVRMIAAAL